MNTEMTLARFNKVAHELSDLTGKIDRLWKFKRTQHFHEMEDRPAKLLSKQLLVMIEYSLLLVARLSEESKEDFND